MQAIRPLSSSSSSLSSSPYGYVQFENSAKIAEDFSSKLFIGDEPPTTGALYGEGVASEDKAQECEIEDGNEEENDDDEDEDEEEEEEFSFACANPNGSPICADDVFQNGEIRPVFPIFNRDLLFAGADDGDGAGGSGASSAWPSLRKIFVEEANDLRPSSSASESDELEGVPEGTYCEWSGKAAASSCKKSNSTGFSRLWRFRDLVHRSSSDGKDAFVFLNPNNHHHHHNNSTHTTAATKPSNEAVRKTDKAEEEEKKKSSSYGKATAAKGKAKGRQTASSAHEKHYVRNRAKKEGDKRRSYLPYRQDLVGFFTNVNGLSRNVHPF